jgi:ATP-binding cassette subfamily B protein
MLVLLNPVLTGAVTVGMFISLVNAIFGLVQAMSWELTYHVDQLAKHNEYLKDLTEFAALDETGEAVELPVFPLPAFESLEFRNVRFKYPGTDNYVLDGISFRIDAGKHYAFVGINGSGKTTITKLMTGLYDDFEGDILINGRIISTYSQREIKALFSVVYQDFARYYISMNDNIALGDVNKMQEEENPERVREAIMKAGLEETAAKLPLGLDTPLGKIKEGGQDVSGGEWQKIAMARAVFNPAPVRILDEPTASLDPVSESRMYKEFEKISRDKTTIFISHRLGSTKLAHEIFVLGNGRIIEKGDHQHLMNLDGVYAQMYESQRSWYE